ncbi:Rad54b [Symbiodinium natans]|uniref:Rad54b protein n=1 Tax=Symbiodinium natans TaxID=878477 RepID=A0A812PD85_9DINO|nr:Rad54b [Symbiodinium natans]
MLQGEQAVVQAGIVHQFRQRLTPTSSPPRAGRSNTVVLRPGSAGATRIYAVHGLDGDVMSDGSSYATLAKYLDPCRVCALVYEEEAYACDTVPALAACYNQRVLEDARRNGGLKEENPILVAGYSHGCVVAHQMACQLEEAGISVGVILFDLEVTWPPPATNSRVGGYSFLGGEAEAILLISRAFGKFEFAMKEAVELNLAKEASQSIDVDALRQRAFEALNQKGLPYELFAHIVKRSGMNIERLHYLGNPWEPPRAFAGPALMVVAPDSPEFASAREINAQYCKQMEAVTGKGSHYNMLQGEQAVVQAGIVHQFRQRLMPTSPNGATAGQALADLAPRSATEPPSVFVEGLCPLTRGVGAVLYYMHGLDGDAFGPGVTLGEVPYLLSCSVCALEYDDEAFACETVDALVKLYKARIMKDFAQRPEGEHLVLAGRSCGALLACLAALQLQEENVSCSLVILDSEVVWPSKLDTTFCYEWLGGEVEATLWLAHLGGATSFGQEQVLAAVTRGAASPVAEGPARLQTQAYGQCASQLEACGVRSLKDFRNICTLASSNAERLRQLLVPSAATLPAADRSWPFWLQDDRSAAPVEIFATGQVQK